jgi:4-hydroxy-L-threonine phosphate dehydrogenase PdxA
MARLWYDEDQENVNEKIKQLLKISNPKKVIENAQQYFNDPNIKVYLSTRKKSKYAIYDPINKKLVHFGNINYEDYTRHLNDKRRQNYLSRASNIRGNWKSNPYSASNMAIHILWQ